MNGNCAVVVPMRKRKLTDRERAKIGRGSRPKSEQIDLIEEALNNRMRKEAYLALLEKETWYQDGEE